MPFMPGSAQPQPAASTTSRTIGGVVAAVRQILNDTAPSTGGDLSGTQSTYTIGDTLTAARRLLSDMRPDFPSEPNIYAETYMQTMTVRPDGTVTDQSADAAAAGLFYNDVLLRMRGQLADFWPSANGTLPATSLAAMPTALTIGTLMGDIRQALNDPAVNPIENAYWTSTTTGASITDAGVLGSEPNASGGGLLFGIASARSILNDTVAASYRYSDTDLKTYFADAAAMVFRLRPDACVYAFDVSQVSPPVSIFLPLYTEFFPAIVDFVVGRAQARDDSSADEAKSAAYYEAFRTTLLRGPYRHSDSFIQAALREALGQVQQRRPDLILMDVLAAANTPASMPTDPTVAWPLADWLYPLFIDYVVARANLRNDAMSLTPGPLAAMGSATLARFTETLGSGLYRFSDGTLIAAIVEAVADMLRRRPDLFPEGFVIPPTQASITQFIPFAAPNDFIAPVIDFAIARVLARVGFDEKDQVEALLARYETAIGAGPYRYTQSFLFHLFNQALLHIRRRRPDLTIDDTTAQPVYIPGNEGLVFPLDDAYMPLVVDYIAAQAVRRDAHIGGSDAQAAPLLAGVDAQLDAAPYRYSDGALYTLVTEAIGETRRVRPDLWLGLLRIPLPAYTASSATTLFPIDEAYFAPVVSYVVGRAQQRDRPGPDDGKAPAFLGLFSRQMGGA